ncbi:MAG TPA: hypothetical protein VEW42_06065 [Candidatus Eisenbacteria bacterium]|nr:hypothetical protein [Candidatus Eisenbacteria bacterium]
MTKEDFDLEETRWDITLPSISYLSGSSTSNHMVNVQITPAESQAALRAKHVLVGDKDVTPLQLATLLRVAAGSLVNSPSDSYDAIRRHFSKSGEMIAPNRGEKAGRAFDIMSDAHPSHGDNMPHRWPRLHHHTGGH